MSTAVRRSTPSHLYRPLDLIRRFEVVAPSCPGMSQHARKGIHLLLPGIVSSSPQTIAFGMLALSTAAGGLVFAVAQLFQDTRVATLAMCSRSCFRRSRFSRCRTRSGPLGAGFVQLWLVYHDNRQPRYLWLWGKPVFDAVHGSVTVRLSVVFIGMMVHRCYGVSSHGPTSCGSRSCPSSLLVHVVMRLMVGSTSFRCSSP